MRRTLLMALAVVCCGLLAVACGGDADEDAGGLPPEPGRAPNKAQALVVLRDLLDTLERRDYDAALRFLLPSAVKDEAKAKKRLAGLLKKNEISRAGLDVLAARGRYGPLNEVFPDQGPDWAARAGVDAARCSAFRAGDAAVVLYGGDDNIRILRLDNVGKLK